MFRSTGKGDAHIVPVTTRRHTVASRWGSHLPRPCPLAPDIHQQTVYGSHHDGLWLAYRRRMRSRLFH